MIGYGRVCRDQFGEGQQFMTVAAAARSGRGPMSAEAAARKGGAAAARKGGAAAARKDGAAAAAPPRAKASGRRQAARSAPRRAEARKVILASWGLNSGER